MTAVASERPTGPGPHLTASPWAGRVISVLFVATIALFLVGLLALGV